MILVCPPPERAARGLSPPPPEPALDALSSLRPVEPMTTTSTTVSVRRRLSRSRPLSLSHAGASSSITKRPRLSDSTTTASSRSLTFDSPTAHLSRLPQTTTPTPMQHLAPRRNASLPANLGSSDDWDLQRIVSEVDARLALERTAKKGKGRAGVAGGRASVGPNGGIVSTRAGKERASSVASDRSEAGGARCGNAGQQVFVVASSSTRPTWPLGGASSTTAAAAGTTTISRLSRASSTEATSAPVFGRPQASSRLSRPPLQARAMSAGPVDSSARRRPPSPRFPSPEPRGSGPQPQVLTTTHAEAAAALSSFVPLAPVQPSNPPLNNGPPASPRKPPLPIMSHPSVLSKPTRSLSPLKRSSTDLITDAVVTPSSSSTSSVASLSAIARTTYQETTPKPLPTIRRPGGSSQTARRQNVFRPPFKVPPPTGAATSPGRTPVQAGGGPPPWMGSSASSSAVDVFTVNPPQVGGRGGQVRLPPPPLASAPQGQKGAAEGGAAPPSSDPPDSDTSFDSFDGLLKLVPEPPSLRRLSWAEADPARTQRTAIGRGGASVSNDGRSGGVVSVLHLLVAMFSLACQPCFGAPLLLSFSLDYACIASESCSSRRATESASVRPTRLPWQSQCAEVQGHASSFLPVGRHQDYGPEQGFA